MLSVNGIQITPTLFSDNTSQVWKLPNELLDRRHVFIKWDFSHEGEFLQLAQLQDLLSNAGINSNLQLSYLPYGRQDKQVLNNQTFALRTFARLINSLGFNEVSCFDPHSTVPEELITNFVPIRPVEQFNKVRSILKPDLMCYPDKGAKSKYTKFFTEPYIYADKVRNQLTGEITSIELVGDCKEKSVLIWDDICDYGNTFIKIAYLLQKGKAKDINLYVSHGIFSSGLRPLLNAGISHVYTKDGESFPGIDNNVLIKKFE